MIDTIRQRLKDLYEDAVDHFTGRDRAVELLEKEVWGKYHAEVAVVAESFATEGGLDEAVARTVKKIRELRLERDADLAAVETIEKNLEE